MVTLRYLFADLTRRRYWTLASLACFTVTIASQTSLAFTGFALSIDLNLFTERVPIGIHFLFSRLLVFTTLLSIAAGASIFAGMSLTQTVERRRDVAVMKAIGSTREVGSFFLGETFLTSGGGVLLGTSLGTIVYLVLGLLPGHSLAHGLGHLLGPSSP